MKKYFREIGEYWSKAWADKSLRNKVILGLCLNLAVFFCLPAFFNYAEGRDGTLMNDWLLNSIPSFNVSFAIALIICGSCAFFFFRTLTSPDIFITFLFSYVLLNLLRVTMIFFIPLNPPLHLIALSDPISNILYIGGFKTKDLFFSGHESVICLMGMCLVKKNDRIVMLIAAIVLAGLILVQHIHYTVDVVFAPLFSFVCFQMSKKFIGIRNLSIKEAD